MLGNGGIGNQPDCSQHVGGEELRSALRHGGYESDVAGEPVRAGDHQHGAALPALVRADAELRAVWSPVILGYYNFLMNFSRKALL